jgi:phosphatidylglycerol:prolipoprotein diacylglycerol transferase
MYGLMIILGILSGIGIAAFRGKKYGISGEDVIFSSCYAGIGLIIGAKIMYLFTILPELAEYRNKLFANPSLLLPLLTAGFVFYGGLIGAFIGYLLYCKKYHINLVGLLDLIAPSIPIIHGFGRIGCFFAGCCYGITYYGPFHVIFHNTPFAPTEIPLLPVQLIESGLNLTAGIVLLIFAGRIRKPGRILGIYLIYYAVMRFVLEYFRGDIERGLYGGLSTSQWISILILPVGIWLYYGIRTIKSPVCK